MRNEKGIKCLAFFLSGRVGQFCGDNKLGSAFIAELITWRDQFRSFSEIFTFQYTCWRQRLLTADNDNVLCLMFHLHLNVYARRMIDICMEQTIIEGW